MTADRQSLLERLFHEAVELADADRDTFLRRVRDQYPSVAAELEELVGLASTPVVDPAGFLERAMGGATPAGEPTIPDKIGPYEIDHLLGSGGMGTVYAAIQRHPRRMVAIKTVSPRVLSPGTLRRFEFEVQTLASLRHAGIAQIYDAGVYEENGVTTPYFAMEYVPHRRSITQFASDHELSKTERIELFIEVCDAVQHGHRKGVIHRDLKPDNILVDGSDRTSRPKIIDFGIARATEDSRATKDVTSTGQLIGTLQYMSPEQLKGDAREIDVTTDVYSLGLILYKLLTGNLPYEISGLPLAEAIRRIADATPSTTTHGELRGDLKVITATALAPNKDRRYPSPLALASDLRRFLKSQPIAARRPGLAYRVGVFTRRNPAVVVAALTVLIFAIAASIVSTRWALLAQRHARESERQLYQANMRFASEAINEDLDSVASLLESVPERFRGWEWHHFDSRRDNFIHEFNDAGFVFRQVVSPDGRLLAVSSLAHDRKDGVAIRDLKTGSIVRRLAPTGYGADMAFAPDRDQIVLVRFELDQTAWVERWGIRNGSLAERIELDLRFRGFGEPSVQWNPAMTRLLCTFPEEVLIYDVEQAMIVARTTVRSVDTSWDPSGQLVWIAHQSNPEHSVLEARDPDSLALIRSLPFDHGAIERFALSADGQRWVTAHARGVLRTWDISESPPRLLTTVSEPTAILDVRMSPDGATFAAWSIGSSIRLRHTVTGRIHGQVFSHPASIQDVRYVPGHRTLISIDAGGRTRVWDLALEPVVTLSGHRSYVYPIALTTDGSLLVSGGWDGYTGQPGGLRLWNPLTGAPIAALGRPEDLRAVRAIALADDRTVFAAVDRTLAETIRNEVQRFDLVTGEMEPVYDLKSDSESLSIDAEGRLLAVADRSGTVTIIDLVTGKPILAREVGHLSWRTFYRVAWSQRDDRLAVAVAGDRVELWDAPDYRKAVTWQPHAEGITSLAFDPSGNHLLTASDDRTIGVWDADTGELIARLAGHRSGVLCAVASPDGMRIASGGRDRTIRIWDTETYSMVATLSGHSDYVFSLAWSEDGQRLYSGSGDGTIRIWGSSQAGIP